MDIVNQLYVRGGHKYKKDVTESFELLNEHFGGIQKQTSCSQFGN